MALTKNQASIKKFFDVASKPNSQQPRLTSSSLNQALLYTEDANSVPIPDIFQFPFRPYDIQESFMRKLYETLADGKLGIFESPTGTGKSMSIICGSLTWLRDFEERNRRDLENAIKETERSKEDADKENNKNETSWFSRHHNQLLIADKLSHLKRDLRKYEQLDEKLHILKESKFNMNKNKLVPKIIETSTSDDSDRPVIGDEDEYLVKEYVSDDDEKPTESRELHNYLEEEESNNNLTKIYFCSRTHSQLSQFANEIKKSPFAKDVRVVTMGSRQNSCINDAVQKLKSLSMINDRCRELKKNTAKETKVSEDGEVLKKKKSHGGCPFYRQTHIEELSDMALVDVKDIEELVEVGRKIKACPYYSSRAAHPMAQLILLPYNTLLHKQTREASGISLVGNVVIIDEAHNLLDAISAIHSCQISGSQLTGALSQLTQYKERYSSRLKAKNILYIQQIVFVLTSLLKYLRGLTVTEKLKEEAGTSFNLEIKMHTLNEFILVTGLEDINPYKVLHYCKKSEIARKLLGFSTVHQPTVKLKASGVAAFLDKLVNGSNEKTSPITENGDLEPEVKIATSPLMQIIEFLRCLTNRDHDGRVVVNQQSTLENSSFKYYLLNPAAHFRDIVSEARAVVVAGGTMQPVEEFSDNLFQSAGAQKDRIIQFSCGHVIPSNHLLAMALSHGPSGITFDFSYQNRNSDSLIDELGRCVANICNVVPGGIVCFFPSYDYHALVLTRWRSTDILSKICAKKQEFQEPRNANMTNKVLGAYSRCITNSKNTGRMTGAILFSVVGGKMSEGINFSDDLGRCVIMVGMPYANITSVELKEKMQYLNDTVPKAPDARQPGQIYYENLCMKAVNQSIGRAIRHRLDYATILLLDTRYSKPSVQKALPGWIRNHLKTSPTFGPAFGQVRKFFADKNSSPP